MIELWYWPTPNGHKVTMFLEEADLDYQIRPVNIGQGDQFKADFLAFSPNNRMPAIVDLSLDFDRYGPGGPITVFESGAILQYLADKTGRFGGVDARDRIVVTEWLMWQMAGLGPMLGQNHHFTRYAPEQVPYAIERYTRETTRLYGVLDKRLVDREFIASEYSIADMACYPWILPEIQGQDMANFPNLARWHAAIRERPATQRAYAKGKEINPNQGAPLTDEQKKVLFGQAGK